MKSFLAPSPTTPSCDRIVGTPNVRFGSRSWRKCVAATLLAISTVASMAADVTVTNANNSGAGSLRQAIVDVSAAGVISFTPALAGQTINLTSELILNKGLTIDGAGLVGGMTVSGGGVARLFRVNAGTNVTLRNLTLTGGNGIGAGNSGFGGALFNSGTMTIERCIFSGNTASNYGGGIYNDLDATMSVSNTTFTVNGSAQGNTAGVYGGAISNSSVLTVNGSTFDRSASGFEGGGIYSDFPSTLTIANSTFTGNSATFYGGALFSGSPRMSVVSTTIVGNRADRIGGGIYNDYLGTPSSTLENSIVTENTSPQDANIFGSWTGSNNFITGDPKLSPLANFGGFTPTMPPLPDSPVIDAGGATTLVLDQRGQPRILRTALDIGASESAISDFNPTGVTIYSRVTAGDETGVFEISTDPDFLPVVNTFEGTGVAGFADGPRLAAQNFFPSSVAQDSLGNTYFTDTANNRIRMIGSDGLVVTIAGTGVYGKADGPGPNAAFAFPSAIAVGPDDNVYVADTYNHRICKLTRPAIAGGVWTVIGLAGMGNAGMVEGAGSVARFNLPYGLALDSAGNIYVADSVNHRIRKVTPLGAVSTFAGSGALGNFDSPNALLATFQSPRGVVIYGGDLYVADTLNHRIRKVAAVGSPTAGAVTTFAGSTTGFTDGTGTAARFNTPSGIAADGAGAIYIADEDNNRIRKIDGLGGVTTVAGTGVIGMVNGKSNIAQFNAPTGVAVSSDGNLLVADTENHLLRRITVKPLTVPSLAYTDAFGTQVKQELDVDALGLDPGVTYYFRWKSNLTSVTQPLGQSFYLYDFPTVVTDAASNLTPSSATLNATVDPKNGRTIVSFEYSTDPTLENPYEVTTVASTAAGFSNPTAVVSNAAGDVFVADRLNNRIMKINSAGAITVFAGSGAAGFANGTGTAAQFEKPTGLAIDATGNLFVADESNHRIRKIDPNGVVTTVVGSGVAGFVEGDAGTARLLYPSAVAVDADGNLYIADTGNQRIRTFTLTTGLVSTLAGTGVAGFTDGDSEIAQFSSPQGVAIGTAGTILVADTGNHSVRSISAGNVATLAGTGSQGYVDGPGGSAQFISPRGVVIDSGGMISVTDYGNHRIRQISADGQVSTLAGSGVAGEVDTPVAALFPATATQWDRPMGIAIDGSGTLLVTQESGLRKIARSANLPVVTIIPDADGNGERAMSAAVDRPLLYGATYYFRARGTGYRDSVTGEILSFVTPRGDIAVFAGNSTAATGLANLQTPVTEFGSTPTGQAFTRDFTISNPGNWPLNVSSLTVPTGFQLTGGTGVVPPLGTVTFQITLPATAAGNFSGNVVITSDAPEKTVFSFPVSGVVLDPPTVITLAASAKSSGAATFNASVDPNDSATTVWFEWSQDANFDGVNVTTFAGSGPGYVEGNGVSAKFNQPAGIVTDAAGNTYVADQQNHRIRKITADGTTSNFAGTGVAGFEDGAPTSAQFNQPVGLAISSTGTLYVADSKNHRIRAIDSTGTVITYSGLGTAGFTDGIASAARFSSPAGLAIDGFGVLYVADTENHRIRKIATDGSVSTLAGNGTAGTANGAGTAAEFSSPIGIARDAAGFVYVTESTSHAVRKIAPDGFASDFVGNPASSGFVDATGAAARFSSPTGLGVGIGGLIYVADKGNHRIRSISPSGEVLTIAGTGNSGTADGFGDVAEFFSPSSLTNTATGGLIVGDSGSSTLRKITSLQNLVPAATGLVGTDAIAVAVPVTGLPTSGPYYFRAIATNGGGTTVGAILGENLTAPGFAEWQITHFGNDASDPLIAGFDANPSGDGISNLLKYAFGLDPNLATPGDVPAMSMPGGNLSLTYTKVLAASDVVYTVQWSTDLDTWSSVGVTEQPMGGDAETEEILATVSGAPVGAKFIRIQISLQ